MAYRFDTEIPGYPYHIHDVHISDPCILADPVSKKYYTYVHFIDRERFPENAVDAPTFYVLESPDLIHWPAPKSCFDGAGFWANRDYWAPEGHYYKGKYYIISSFRAPGSYRRCQCLVSDSPMGPFKPIAPDPVTPDGWHCLDGTLYIDRAGNPWMVFCHEWLQVSDGQIAAIRLTEDLGASIGDPIILCRASDGPWADSGVTDGPYLHRLPGGKLIMIWSSFTSKGAYAVGYATSLSGEIYGPWVQEKNPLYAADGGHAMLFYSFGGQLMMSMHSPNNHMKKHILLFEMEETKDKLAIVNEVTGNWYNNFDAPGPNQHWVYKDPIVEAPCFMKDPVAE